MLINIIANWFSPVSWVFKRYVLFRLLVSNYLTGVPVNYLDKLSAFCTVDKPDRLLPSY